MHRFLLALPAVVLLALALYAAPVDDPKPPKPANLDKLNTPADEDEPHLASNGLSLYYSTNANKKIDMLVAQRGSASQPWPAGKPVLDINSKGDTRSVFATPEGVYPQRLYFSTTKDLTKKDQRGDNFDLFFVTKQNARADFTFEQGLPFCTAEDELHPWLGSQGQMYFSRKTKDGWRVFVSNRPKGGGQFGEPTLLKDLPPDFHHATLTADGKTMYLQGPLEKGRWGLFRSSATATGWSMPEPLDDLNDAEGATGDRSPCLSRDGALLYFASDRPGGKGGLDLWVMRTADLKKSK